MCAKEDEVISIQVNLELTGMDLQGLGIDIDDFDKSDVEKLLKEAIIDNFEVLSNWCLEGN